MLNRYLTHEYWLKVFEVGFEKFKLPQGGQEITGRICHGRAAVFGIATVYGEALMGVISAHWTPCVSSFNSVDDFAWRIIFVCRKKEKRVQCKHPINVYFTSALNR